MQGQHREEHDQEQLVPTVRKLAAKTNPGRRYGLSVRAWVLARACWRALAGVQTVCLRVPGAATEQVQFD